MYGHQSSAVVPVSRRLTGGGKALNSALFWGGSIYCWQVTMMILILMVKEWGAH